MRTSKKFSEKAMCKRTKTATWYPLFAYTRVLISQSTMCKPTTGPFVETPSRDTFLPHHLPIAWSAVNKKGFGCELDTTRSSSSSSTSSAPSLQTIGKAKVRHGQQHVRFAIYPQIYFFEKVPSEDRPKLWYSYEEELVMYHTFLEEEGYLLMEGESNQINYTIDDDDVRDASLTTNSKHLQKTEPSIMSSYVISSLRCLLLVYALLAGLDLTVPSDIPAEEGMEVLVDGKIVMNVTHLR